MQACYHKCFFWFRFWKAMTAHFGLFSPAPVTATMKNRGHSLRSGLDYESLFCYLRITAKSRSDLALIAAEILFVATIDKHTVTMTKRLKRKAGPTRIVVLSLRFKSILFLKIKATTQNFAAYLKSGLKLSCFPCFWQCLFNKLANVIVRVFQIFFA